MDLPDKTQPVVPKKNITPVASGVVQVKRPATKRFFDFLFAESPKEIGKRVASEVIVPRLKGAFEEAANSFLSGMLWRNGDRPSNIVKGTILRGGGINYNQASINPMVMARQATVNQSSGNYQDLLIPTQQMAESILANMYDLLNQYRVVAVADLYELAGITPAPSDNAYGWTSLDTARITHDRDGYCLELPRPTLV